MSYLERAQNSLQMHVELCVYNHHSNTMLCFRLDQAKRDALPLTPAVIDAQFRFPAVTVAPPTSSLVCYCITYRDY